MDDAARAILLAAEHYNGSEPINIGTGEEITIQELAHLIADEVGFKGALVWDTGKPNGQPRRCLSIDRAKKLFGFRRRTRSKPVSRKRAPGSTNIACIFGRFISNRRSCHALNGGNTGTRRQRKLPWEWFKLSMCRKWRTALSKQQPVGAERNKDSRLPFIVLTMRLRTDPRCALGNTSAMGTNESHCAIACPRVLFARCIGRGSI